ncbi:oxygenase MpaB family protein [Phytomonospora sp. NPDC050363]|uniref:oxygenase MpaB family protein n=1 Tax=Phytomonospora sp. NPDC050363 TaxID=3155642 RepID=UPI0033FBC986
MEDHGLFGPDSVTWPVHTELVMWIGGLRALYLQSLHPRVMRGTFQNSALFDPKKAWSRFIRTAQFVHVRTFGDSAAVEAAAARVRAIHAGLTGHDSDTGETFRLDEPSGLLWVHCAEIDSYVDIARRSGAIPTDELADRYVDENRRAAEVLGLDLADVPASRAELREYFEGMRPSLYACDEAKQGLLRSFNPPLPRELAILRLGVPAANTLAISSLPGWAKAMFGIPTLPGAHTATTLQLRALRGVTSLAMREPVDERIAGCRRDAAAMMNGTFVSKLMPAAR